MPHKSEQEQHQPSAQGALPAATVGPIYSILHIEVKDKDAFQKYLDGQWKTVEKHGGQFMIAGGDFDVIQGKWVPGKIIAHKWPNVEAFHRWYGSEEYRPWKEIFAKAASVNILLVEGLRLEEKARPSPPCP